MKVCSELSSNKVEQSHRDVCEAAHTLEATRVLAVRGAVLLALVLWNYTLNQLRYLKIFHFQYKMCNKDIV